MTPSRVDRTRLQATILGILAAEQYCSREDLLDGEVHVVDAGPPPTETAYIPGGRWFDRPEPYFSLVTVGVGGVVTASPELMSWVRPLYRGVDRDQMMEPARIAEVTTRMADRRRSARSRAGYAQRRISGRIPRRTATQSRSGPTRTTTAL